jgi:hypothetical protein
MAIWTGCSQGALYSCIKGGPEAVTVARRAFLFACGIGAMQVLHGLPPFGRLAGTLSNPPNKQRNMRATWHQTQPALQDAQATTLESKHGSFSLCDLTTTLEYCALLQPSETQMQHKFPILLCSMSRHHV